VADNAVELPERGNSGQRANGWLREYYQSNYSYVGEWETRLVSNSRRCAGVWNAAV